MSFNFHNESKHVTMIVEIQKQHIIDFNLQEYSYKSTQTRRTITTFEYMNKNLTEK